MTTQTQHNPTLHSDAEVEASIHAVLDAFQADSPFGAAAGATEAEFVLECLDKGEVNGGTFGAPNTCSCLIGSAMRARHDIPGLRLVGTTRKRHWAEEDEADGEVRWQHRFSERGAMEKRLGLNRQPAEYLFDHIRPGHTPQNHAPAAFARDCIQRWLNAQNPNGAPVVNVTAQGWTRRELDALQEEVRA